jgi:hypothetical protein
MESYKVEETDNSPKVHLDANNHCLEFEGDSRPEDVLKFYTPITNWLNDYQAHLSRLSSNITDLTCNFKFDYFNSSSAKVIMDIIIKIGDINDNNTNVNIIFNWFYFEADEDLLDAGEEFEELLGISFNYIIIE